ncbi:tyrosine-type recombinase/integrase [Microvirga sp. VF16]|uniref:tyrosine-type recombinase/integrase n=1 Tax=Microvirga sp. VF16 TaxID=2807101 RepID=UPI00193D859B|nr:tyrosine-type recombinase/integrase [Microvirga sp. VF16]QRM34789.1 tyrosine-type recombinase/integrase [Microvirga sp. VF16]
MLIGQFAQVLRALSLNKSKGTVTGYISALRVFWRFMATLEARGHPPVADIATITPELGQLYKLHLLNDLKLRSYGRNHLQLVARLVELTRARLGIVPHRLIWPTIQDQRGSAHKDIEPAALRTLYTAAKGVVRRFASAHAEGQHLLPRGRDPRPHRNRTPVWAERENIAWLTRHYLDVLIDDPGGRSTDALLDKRFRSTDRNPVFPAAYPDGTLFDRFRWFVPTAEDTTACIVLVLLHTGWNVETVMNLDISVDDWHQHRLSSDAGETVAIFSQKKRSSREQVAFSLTRPEFHPFRAIKDMVERTEPLRQTLRRRLAALENQDAAPHHQDEIIRLRRAISSPWLFLSKNARHGGRIGAMPTSRDAFAECFRSLLNSAGIEGTLSPSDLRDGFTSFLYGNSLYNVLLIKRALGHGDLNATKHYLRQRKMLAQRFADYTAWSEALFDEIKRFQRVDPTILYIRARFGDINEEQRQRLADHRLRTRMGMGCLDPEHPSTAIAPMHVGGLCAVQRCILCRHGVIFTDSFEPLARRLAELRVIVGAPRWIGGKGPPSKRSGSL